MSQYIQIRNNPPLLKIKENPKEIIFTLISCMCDNISYVKLKRDDHGEFKLSHYNNNVGLSFSNLQCNYQIHDILWEADDGNFENVIEMLNSGTSVISEVKSR